MRENSQCKISGIKEIDGKHGSVRPDLMIVADNLELACGECGKEDCGGAGKKELMEKSLHMPKVMKDMFCRSLVKGKRAVSLARSLKVVAMNENSKFLSFVTLPNFTNLNTQTGTRLKVSVMDCPKGYVCRVRHLPEYEIPVQSSMITDGLFNVMKATLKAKVSFLTVI